MEVLPAYAYPKAAAPSVIVHAQKENKRPIGYTAWSSEDEEKPKPTRKPRARKKPVA